MSSRSQSSPANVKMRGTSLLRERTPKISHSIADFRTNESIGPIKRYMTRRTLYQCKYCKITYLNENDLKTHFRNFHSGKTFESRLKFEDYLRFRCTYCGGFSDDWEWMEKHHERCKALYGEAAQPTRRRKAASAASSAAPSASRQPTVPSVSAAATPTPNCACAEDAAAPPPHAPSASAAATPNCADAATLPPPAPSASAAATPNCADAVGGGAAASAKKSKEVQLEGFDAVLNCPDTPKPTIETEKNASTACQTSGRSLQTSTRKQYFTQLLQYLKQENLITYTDGGYFYRHNTKEGPLNIRYEKTTIANGVINGLRTKYGLTSWDEKKKRNSVKTQVDKLLKCLFQPKDPQCEVKEPQCGDVA